MKNLIFSFLTLSTLTFAASSYAEMPEPYCSIADLPFDDHGWFGNAEQLDACLNEKEIKTIIEIGSWLGCSTRYFATSIGPEGKVYAIDTWRGSQDESLHLQDPRLPYLYQLFLSNVKHAGLTDKIIPFRMASVEAAKGLNVMADLIYLDGAHDTASVYDDITYWYPHLKEGGIMCGDDWLWPTVQAAVIKGAKERNLSIHAYKNFWRYY